MEATIANATEHDDVVLVGVSGYFGNRLVDMAGRYGADVRTLTKPWGQVFTLEELRSALERHQPSWRWFMRKHPQGTSTVGWGR